MSYDTVILASQSEGRRHVLALAGLRPEIMPSSFDEYAVKSTDFSDRNAYVETIAAGKLLEVSTRLESPESTVLIGGDLVVYVDDTVFHKPSTFAEARKYMKILSGRAHDEVSASAIWTQKFGIQVQTETTVVHVPELSDQEIEEYLQISNPLAKAAGFSILATQKILKKRNPPTTTTITGSFTGLLGLNLRIIEQFLLPINIQLPVKAEQVESQLIKEYFNK